MITKARYRVIININNKNKYVSKIQKSANMTTQSIYSTIKYLEEIGIVRRENFNNRDKIIFLTEKGKELKKELIKLKDLMGGSVVTKK